MAAKRAAEEQRSKRRKQLIKGLLLGGAAIGLPALANALVARRVKPLPAARWGRGQRYAWGGGEIVYQRLGDGPAVLLLHSFGPGHDGEQWRQVAEILAADHRVLVPDLLGWGASRRPRGSFDAQLYIALLADLLADVAGGRAAVVAAGLPAAYAVQVAADHPERLRGLGLVSPLGLELHGDEPDLRDTAVNRLLRLPVLGTSALNLVTSRSAIEHHLRHEVYAAPERVDAALVERHWRGSHQQGAQAALAAYLAGCLDHGVEQALEYLEVPTWIAWGRHAVCPAVEAADLWLHQVEAELEVFEGSGCLPHAEEPAAFCQRLRPFLAQLPD